jgi:hypothetical protein
MRRTTTAILVFALVLMSLGCASWSKAAKGAA